ncbi:MAG: type II toxin-antitoxin system PemK/MazF family toxin [Candidatus Gracilibacteria bacterium]|nr:type II toxin-antitoxin system PemK/MazF family toxin [Candidatus Gracilibacteria bacterium]MDQ7023469.1 type II toxin-antitoxin system PemK/MazF family toxin [Candidatus Gracilibacteria bacterium]
MKKTGELFELWNKKKNEIDIFGDGFKKVVVGEIWVCTIGVNIGNEISKDGDFLRPVLIVGNYMGGDLVSIIPITTKYKKQYSKFLLEIDDYYNKGLSRKSYLSLNNFKTISKKRLVYKINNTYKINKYFKLLSKNFINKILEDIFNLNKKITLR